MKHVEVKLWRVGVLRPSVVNTPIQVVVCAQDIVRAAEAALSIIASRSNPQDIHVASVVSEGTAWVEVQP